MMMMMMMILIQETPARPRYKITDDIDAFCILNQIKQQVNTKNASALYATLLLAQCG